MATGVHKASASKDPYTAFFCWDVCINMTQYHQTLAVSQLKLDKSIELLQNLLSVYKNCTAAAALLFFSPRWSVAEAVPHAIRIVAAATLTAPPRAVPKIGAGHAPVGHQIGPDKMLGSSIGCFMFFSMLFLV